MIGMERSVLQPDIRPRDDLAELFGFRRDEGAIFGRRHDAKIDSATPISMGNALKPKIHPTIVVIQDEAGANRLARYKLPIPPNSAKMPNVPA
jgi:hypothetical protein